MSLNIGSHVYVYQFRLLEKNRYKDGRPTFTINTHTIIGENDKRVVIDDPLFTTIEKLADKNSWDYSLGTPRTSVFVNDSILGSGVDYRLYSLEKVKASQIRATIKKAIRAKVGFFLNDIDLEIISDRAINQ